LNNHYIMLDFNHADENGNVYYFSYGANMSPEVLINARKVNPISSFSAKV